MREGLITYELHLAMFDHERSITIYAFDGFEGQGRLVDQHDIGPFETGVEVSQWVWRILGRDMAAAMR